MLPVSPRAFILRTPRFRNGTIVADRQKTQVARHTKFSSKAYVGIVAVPSPLCDSPGTLAGGGKHRGATRMHPYDTYLWSLFLVIQHLRIYIPTASRRVEKAKCRQTEIATQRCTAIPESGPGEISSTSRSTIPPAPLPDCRRAYSFTAIALCLLELAEEHRRISACLTQCSPSPPQTVRLTTKIKLYSHSARPPHPKPSASPLRPSVTLTPPQHDSPHLELLHDLADEGGLAAVSRHHGGLAAAIPRRFGQVGREPDAAADFHRLDASELAVRSVQANGPVQTRVGSRDDCIYTQAAGRDA